MSKISQPGKEDFKFAQVFDLFKSSMSLFLRLNPAILLMIIFVFLPAKLDMILSSLKLYSLLFPEDISISSEEKLTIDI